MVTGLCVVLLPFGFLCCGTAVLVLGGTCGGAALSTWSLYAMGAASYPSAGQLPPSLLSFALTLPLAFLAKGLSHFIRTMSVPAWHIRTCLTALPMSFYCRRPAFRRTTFARPVLGPMRRTASLPLVPSCPSRRTSMVSAELSGGASLSFLRRVLSTISMSLRTLLATLAPCWLQVAYHLPCVVLG